MKPQVILRKIAAAADHFAKLPQVASRRAHACIQSQAVTLDTLQLKADPVIPRATLGTQNHGLANQILNHRFDLAIIEEVAYRHSTAHLRNLDGGPSQRTDVLESSIMLVQEQQLWFRVGDLRMEAVHLGIHMSVNQKEILPTINPEIDKRISPTHIPPCPLRNNRHVLPVHKIHLSIILIQLHVHVDELPK